MEKKKRNFILIPIIIIIALILGTFALYKYSFEPKVPVTPITSEVKVNPLDMAIKLIPNKLNFSSNEIITKSNIELSDSDLTNLALLSIKENPNASDKIDGLKVLIDGNYINLYIQFKYLNIPLEAKLTFSTSAQNGNGILHYEGGKLGFINISKDIVFDNLVSNSVMDVDKANGNLILKFKENYNISITNLKVEGNKVKIELQASFKPFS